MIFWLFGFVCIAGALAATFLSDIRLAALALWVVGLAAGGLYLFLGAELLCVLQWIVATLACASLIFYSVMFGEYRQKDPLPLRRRLASALMPVVAGVVLMVVFWMGSRSFGLLGSFSPAQFDALITAHAVDLLAIGRQLAKNNFLALEILALILFLIVIGAGVIGRPEERDS
jgi:NADH:ubiquinone oxidoreductase subunit 6 (subunit J)